MTPPAGLKSELTKTQLELGAPALSEDFDREIRALETRGFDTNVNFNNTETENPMAWVDDIWKDKAVVDGIEHDIRFVQAEWSKGRSAEDVQKITEFADDISLQFKKIHGAFANGRSAEGAALLVEVKDKLQTLRRDAWWKSFLTHGETNALQKLIGEQEIQAAKWSKQEALAELQNAKLDAEAMRNQAKAKKKNGFLSAIIAIVAIVVIVVSMGTATPAVAAGLAGASGAGAGVAGATVASGCLTAGAISGSAMVSGGAAGLLAGGATVTGVGTVGASVGLTAMQGFQLASATYSLGNSINQMA